MMSLNFLWMKNSKKITKIIIFNILKHKVNKLRKIMNSTINITFRKIFMKVFMI